MLAHIVGFIYAHPNQDKTDAASENFFFHGSSAWKDQHPVSLNAYSVETCPLLFLSAVNIACHAKVAHLTRIGNSQTPDNTSS